MSCQYSHLPSEQVLNSNVVQIIANYDACVKIKTVCVMSAGTSEEIFLMIYIAALLLINDELDPCGCVMMPAKYYE